MSSKKFQRYERLVLVVAILGSLGLGSLVAIQARKLDETFTTRAVPRQDAPDLPGTDTLGVAERSLGAEKSWTAAEVRGRALDLFTGITWFVAKDRDAPVDLLAPDEPPVHPPIPNRWWIENGIDPGFANSPARDADQDGFSNREEYVARTDPRDSASHPELAAKLRLAALETIAFLLKPTSEDGQGGYKITYADTREENNKTKAFVSRGDTFFTTTPGLQRFRFKDVVVEQVPNPRTNSVTPVEFALIEDLKPGKAGRIYRQKRGMRDHEKADFLQRDHTAVLELAAAGQHGVKFRVEESTRFALPFDEKAAEKPYLFKEVRNDDTVVIEWTANGESRTVELPVPPR